MNEKDNHCDQVFKEILDLSTGVYVDCGANNGLYNTKTKDLDKRGWTGVCIEANPEQFKDLILNRKEPTCINTALYDEDDVSVTLTIDGRGSGGGSTVLPVDQGAPKIVVKDTITCNTQTLDTIFQQNNITKVDFLKTDLEGVDAKILLALDLTKVNISFICYEQFPKLADSTEYKKLEDKLTAAGFVKIKSLREVTDYFDGNDIVWCLEAYCCN